MPNYDPAETEKIRAGAFRYRQGGVGPPQRDWDASRQDTTKKNLEELHEILLRTPHLPEERQLIQQQLEHQQVARLYTELPAAQGWIYGNSRSQIRSHASRSSAAGLMFTDYSKSRFARMNIGVPSARSLPELAPAKPMSETQRNFTASMVELKLRTRDSRNTTGRNGGGAHRRIGGMRFEGRKPDRNSSVQESRAS
eukprot:TRINITY_DN36398_c0_g1_i1.p1 TRINITY_DN36398_c0_g1~~TRINITY_DN36398_c0_g1_i1.p1  ORF type:complete len:197 (+),score=15.94 TRINITY_DN36398_c0_g1_i1:108-698(+)